MSYHSPISIKTTYTNTSSELVEKEFRSLCQASKFFSISPQTLKELYLGGTPKLPENVPKDIKVTRNTTTTTTTTTTKPQTKILPDEKWHCDICNKDMKNKSKYVHMATIGHKKNLDKLNEITQTPVEKTLID